MRIPRALGIILLLGLVFVVGGIFLLVTIPGVISDLSEFGEALPRKVEALTESLRRWLAQLGVEQIPTSLHGLMDTLERSGADTTSMAGRAVAPVASFLETVVGGTVSMVGAAAGALIIPVLAFYLLYDFDRIVAAAADLVPRDLRPFVGDVASEVDEVLSQFVRGQLSVMVILGGLYAVGYSIAGIKLAVVIGILAGLVSFIPYVGSALALVLALVVVALDQQSWVQALWVVGVYSVIQMLEGFVITPKIVGEKVGLSAVWVLIALMVGGELFGFFGVLIALPVAAVGKVFVVRAVAWYKKSEWYLGSHSSHGPALAILKEEGFRDSESVRDAKAAVQEDETPDEGR